MTYKKTVMDVQDSCTSIMYVRHGLTRSFTTCTFNLHVHVSNCTTVTTFDNEDQSLKIL